MREASGPWASVSNCILHVLCFPNVFQEVTMCTRPQGFRADTRWAALIRGGTFVAKRVGSERCGWETSDISVRTEQEIEGRQACKARWARGRRMKARRCSRGGWWQCRRSKSDSPSVLRQPSQGSHTSSRPSLSPLQSYVSLLHDSEMFFAPVGTFSRRNGALGYVGWLVELQMSLVANSLSWCSHSRIKCERKFFAVRIP